MSSSSILPKEKFPKDNGDNKPESVRGDVFDVLGSEVSSSSELRTGDKSTNTKLLGTPSLDFGLFVGGRLANCLPAAEIRKELFQHSRDRSLVRVDVPRDGVRLTRHNFLPFAGGATCTLFVRTIFEE